MTHRHEVQDCYPCAREPVGAGTAPSERIWVGRYWRVVHAVHCTLPGWLVLVPRRHVVAIAELSVDEAVELGRAQWAASVALHEVLGCDKTYLAQFAEAEGFAHVHVHVVPRMPDLTADRIGPGVFAHLGGAADEWVDQAAMDALAARLAPVLERLLAS